MTEKTTAEVLRAKFKPEEIGKLPRVTCPNCSDPKKRCDDHQKRKCAVCGAYVSERHIHIDYVGHADVTSRLLDADEEWSWEPQARDIDPAVLASAAAAGPEVLRAVLENAPPKFDLDDRGSPVGLWIRLTVGGSTRPGYGSCPSGQSDAVKVLIGDALRNAAMRFGVALDLWAKGDRADPTAENATASAGQAARGRQQQTGQSGSRPPQGTAVRAQQPEHPAPTGEVDEDAQPFAEEASQCRTVTALGEVHVKAREAHKLAALIRNPKTGGTGGLGQYISWLKKQLEDTDAALRQLTEAAAAAGLDGDALDAKVNEITGAGIEAATAAQLREAAAALAMVPA